MHRGERGLHGGAVDLPGAGFGDQLRRVEAQIAAVGLAEFLAAAVAVQIAEGADIHHDVVGVQAPAKPGQNLVAPRARLQRHVDHFGALPLAPRAGQFVQFAERAGGDRVEQRGGDIGGDVGGAHEIDAVGLMAGARRQILRGPEFEIFAGLRDVLVGIGVARQGGGQGLGLGVGIPDAIGQGGAGLRDFVAQAAQFLVLGSLQPPDLLLHRAYAGHLPHIGGNAPEEQVARHIEGAGGEVALIGVRLHVLGARQTLAQGGNPRFALNTVSCLRVPSKSHGRLYAVQEAGAAATQRGLEHRDLERREMRLMVMAGLALLAATTAQVSAQIGNNPGGGGDCQALWVERNQFYKDAGYCFKTQRAIQYFSNDGCTVQDESRIRFSPDVQRRIQEIIRQERAMNCPR